MGLWQRGRSWYYDFWYKGRRYVGCLGHYQATRRENSFKTCVSHVKIFNRYFGKKRLTDITVQDVQVF